MLTHLYDYKERIKQFSQGRYGRRIFRWVMSHTVCDVGIFIAASEKDCAHCLTRAGAGSPG